MSTIPTLPSDRQLVGAVRSGSDAAWNELMGRHESSVRSMIAKRRDRRTLAQRLAWLRDDIEHGPETDEGDPAIRAFRPRVLAAFSGGTYGPTAPGEQPENAPDDDLLAVAFSRLPEPWQTVLWHAHVEQLTAAEISPLVGRAANDVSELLHTAERGLVDAFLVEHLTSESLDDDTRAIVPLLGGYVRRTLPPHDERRVQLHLEAVEQSSDSRRLIDVISSIESELPRAIAPGITGISVAQQRTALGTTTRAFGAATLSSERSTRVRRAAMLGAAAAIFLVLVGAVFVVRQPFDNSGSVATVTQPDGVTETSDAPDVDEPVDSVVDAVETTTTVLDLRPEPSGPRNEIELGIETGTRPLGLVAVDDQLSVTVDAPGPAYAGGTGTIDVSVTNAGSTDADATLVAVLPSGIVWDALSDGDAECVDPLDDSPFCNVTVPAGGRLDLSLRFSLQSSTVGRIVVDGEHVTEPFEAAIVATPDLVHASIGRGGVTMIGNSLMTCADDEALELGIDCDAVRDGRGEFVNRWDVPMEFIGASRQFGLENSSTSTLELPEGATVVSAHLYWSGDLDERQQSIPDDGSNRFVTLASPLGEITAVVADRISLGDVDATQYLGSADVTEFVTTGGAGDYIVGNVQSVEVQGSYAAWSLVVVYDDETMPVAQRVVTRPFEWIAPEPRFDYAVDLPLPVVQDAPARLSVLAFEGERGFSPELFDVGGTPIGGDAVFDSTVTGPRLPSHDNNLGVDIDAYDLVIDTADGTLPIRATSEKDGVRLAVVALHVDLES